MSYTRSKHQGRYQWHEVQDLVRELAQQLRQRHTVEPIESPPDDPPQIEPQQSSRILREENLRSQRGQQPAVIPAKHQNPSSTIDLNAFRQSWASREQIDQNSSFNEHSKSTPMSPERNRWTEIITIEDQSSPPIRTVHPHAKPMTLSPNPWEQLRDHFIQLREKRLALEKAQDNADG